MRTRLARQDLRIQWKEMRVEYKGRAIFVIIFAEQECLRIASAKAKKVVTLALVVPGSAQQ